MKYYLSPSAPGPFARLVAGVFAALLTAGLLFFGLIALAILVAVVSIAFAVAYLRARWRGRKSGDGLTEKTPGAAEGSVIEAEYTVISRRDD